MQLNSKDLQHQVNSAKTVLVNIPMEQLMKIRQEQIVACGDNDCNGISAPYIHLEAA